MSIEIKLPLTQQQKRVLEFIFEFLHANSYPPTVKEIQDGLSVPNPGTVHKTVLALEKKGYLEKTKRVARGIRLTELGEEIGGSSRQLRLELE